MLIRFNIENFLSFNEKTEFSLIANKERRLPSHIVKGDGVNILKSGVIYGANASGKSNLVKAIDFSRKVITKGIEKLNPVNCHFRLKKDNLNKPTIFNYEIKCGSRYYSYGFAVQLNELKIIEEWLYEIGNSKEKKIFERVVNGSQRHEIEIGIQLSPKAKKRFDVYKEDFQNADSLLFLSEMNRKSIDDFPEVVSFIDVYNWFDKKLTVLKPDSKFAGLNFIGDDIAMSLTFNSFLNVFQTGINNVTSEEIDLASFDIPKKIKEDLTKNIEKAKTIIFEINGITYSLKKNESNEYKMKKIGLEHLTDEGSSIVFDIEDESDGTQRLFDFIPAIHELSKTDSTFIIDELDRSLHSKLTYGIFELFLKLTENNESQLIATSHESLLLDLELLRRDEIWFVEKEKNQSRLYSLDEFKVRNDKIVSKDYLLGRYGAIPIFKSFKNLKF
ncbi:AAA family ATPase [Roseimarinus sediminis]|uniref:AAA family ATPase n=1 Tax=Roseimarinus sediminis TaxID=1610899 RepID=UPI003D1B3ECC